SAAGAAAEMLLPGAIGRTVDAALAQGPPSATPGWLPGPGWPPPARWLAACAALAVISAGSAACGQLLAGASIAGATAWLRQLMTGHILAGGLRLAARFTPGDMVSRIGAGATTAAGAPASAVLAVTAAALPVGSMVAL